MKKILLGIGGVVLLCACVCIIWHIFKGKKVVSKREGKIAEMAERSRALRNFSSRLKEQPAPSEKSGEKIINPFEEAINRLDEMEFNCSDYEDLLIYALIKEDKELEEKVKEKLEKRKEKIMRYYSQKNFKELLREIEECKAYMELHYFRRMMPNFSFFSEAVSSISRKCLNFYKEKAESALFIEHFACYNGYALVCALGGYGKEEISLDEIKELFEDVERTYPFVIENKKLNEQCGIMDYLFDYLQSLKASREKKEMGEAYLKDFLENLKRQDLNSAIEMAEGVAEELWDENMRKIRWFTHALEERLNEECSSEEIPFREESPDKIPPPEIVDKLKKSIERCMKYDIASGIMMSIYIKYRTHIEEIDPNLYCREFIHKYIEEGLSSKSFSVKARTLFDSYLISLILDDKELMDTLQNKINDLIKEIPHLNPYVADFLLNGVLTLSGNWERWGNEWENLIEEKLKSEVEAKFMPAISKGIISFLSSNIIKFLEEGR